MVNGATSDRKIAYLPREREVGGRRTIVSYGPGFCGPGLENSRHRLALNGAVELKTDCRPDHGSRNGLPVECSTQRVPSDAYRK